MTTYIKTTLLNLLLAICYNLQSKAKEKTIRFWTFLLLTISPITWFCRAEHSQENKDYMHVHKPREFDRIMVTSWFCWSSKI